MFGVPQLSLDGKSVQFEIRREILEERAASLSQADIVCSWNNGLHIASALYWLWPQTDWCAWIPELRRHPLALQRLEGIIRECIAMVERAQQEDAREAPVTVQGNDDPLKVYKDISDDTEGLLYAGNDPENPLIDGLLMSDSAKEMVLRLLERNFSRFRFFGLFIQVLVDPLQPLLEMTRSHTSDYENSIVKYGLAAGVSKISPEFSGSYYNGITLLISRSSVHRSEYGYSSFDVDNGTIRLMGSWKGDSQGYGILTKVLEAIEGKIPQEPTPEPDSEVDEDPQLRTELLQLSSKQAETSSKLFEVGLVMVDYLTQANSKHNADIDALRESLAQSDKKHSTDSDALQGSLARSDEKHIKDIDALRGRLAQSDEKHSANIDALRRSVTLADQKHTEDIDALQESHTQSDEKHSANIEALEHQDGLRVTVKEKLDKAAAKIQSAKSVSTREINNSRSAWIWAEVY
ncbi:hypothetical protein HDV00_011360 [Rhizophlyctis rosea]|nr:hypothetical protein HDV00_011360 [Rhizophlyctis rosea]